jgi:hypothetical protein
LVGKPEGKRPLERPRHRWEEGIKMNRREFGWGAMEWIHLAQDGDLWRAQKCGGQPSYYGATELAIQ